MKMNKVTINTNTIKVAALASALALLSGCAAMNTAVSHRNLDVETKMSQSIFLKPVENAQKTVYVEIKNTSNQQDVKPQAQIVSAINANGYKVVQDMKDAHYLLQANILQVGKSSQTAAEQALSGGFGSTLSGVAIGVGAASMSNSSDGATIGAGLIGGIASNLADNLVKDNSYAMVTDLQISEKLPKGQVAQSTTTANMAQGSSTSQVMKMQSDSNWMQYRTRIVSSADKVNLKFETAEPILTTQLANSIAGIF